MADRYDSPGSDGNEVEAGRPAGASGPALDERILDQLDQLDPEGTLVDELADQFLADARDQLVSLDQALVEGDADGLRRSAHTLKGSSANLGATELSRLCGLLSQDQSLGNPTNAELIVRAVDTELDRVAEAFAERVLVR